MGSWILWLWYMNDDGGENTPEEFWVAHQRGSAWVAEQRGSAWEAEDR